MEKENTPAPVKLFIGMISGREDLFEGAGRILSRNYGPIDLYSSDLAWDHSAYYEKEMGPSLKRRFLFFENLISPENLVDIKLKTRELEHMLSHRVPIPSSEEADQKPLDSRLINLDPGYLDLPKIVLASTKDFSHRVYLGRGIFGEVTLLFRDGEYTSLPTTYPEFMKPQHLKLFKKARGLLWKTRENRAPGRPMGAPA